MTKKKVERFKTQCISTQNGIVMTRLTEKLRLSFYIPTRFLSLLSLSSTLHLCKSIARFLHSQTLLPFFSMDNNLFSDNVDYFSDDLDSSSYSLRLNRRLPDSDHLDFALDRVYLLPYRYLSILILRF